MSVDTFLFLSDESLPSIAEWQESLDALGINIQLDSDVDLRTHTGYLPAGFDSHESGFEYFYETAEDVFGSRPAPIGSRSHAVTFVTHSDMRELVCAILAAGALAQISDGLLFDEDSESFVGAEEILAQGKLIAAEELS